MSKDKRRQSVRLGAVCVCVCILQTATEIDPVTMISMKTMLCGLSLHWGRLINYNKILFLVSLKTVHYLSKVIFCEFFFIFYYLSFCFSFYVIRIEFSKHTEKKNRSSSSSHEVLVMLIITTIGYTTNY